MLPQTAPAPPDFAEARQPPQQSRAASLDPSHGYPVEFERKLKRGEAFSEGAV